MKDVIIYACFLFGWPFFTMAQYERCQELRVMKSADLIALQGSAQTHPAGHDSTFLIYYLRKKGARGNEHLLKIKYDEKRRIVVDSISFPSSSQIVLDLKQANNVVALRGIYSVPPQDVGKPIDLYTGNRFVFEYQDIWYRKNETDLKVISFPEHYTDKEVEYSIDHHGRYLTVSTFVSDYLRSTKSDSIIHIFDFSDAKGRERILSCIECIKPQILGDFVYYGKQFNYLIGSDDVDWKIYRAPLFDLSKSQLFGEYIQLVLVSPDGKFILGRKHLYGKLTYVIVNIQTKRFAYVLGRDYLKYKPFYSPAYGKFAFDAPNEIFYVEFPKAFPFKTIGSEAVRMYSTRKADEEFWSRIQILND